MRARDDIKILRQIVGIRDLQRAAAEAAAQRAALALQEAQSLCDESEQQLISLDEGWQAAVAGAALGTGIAAAWSNALLVQASSLRAADARAADARAESDRLINAWRLAILRRDVSRELADLAVRKLGRRREEARLNEAADRHAGKQARL